MVTAPLTRLLSREAAPILATPGPIRALKNDWRRRRFPGGAARAVCAVGAGYFGWTSLWSLMYSGSTRYSGT